MSEKVTYLSSIICLPGVLIMLNFEGQNVIVVRLTLYDYLIVAIPFFLMCRVIYLVIIFDKEMSDS